MRFRATLCFAPRRRRSSDGVTDARCGDRRWEACGRSHPVACSMWAAAGGLVLISLPNFGSWQARRFRADWFHLDLPRHRSHFTARGIETLLRRAGLDPARTATSTSADGLPMSVQYRRYGGRRYKQGAALYVVTALSLASSPLTALVDRAAGQGDVLHAVGRRPETGSPPAR